MLAVRRCPVGGTVGGMSTSKPRQLSPFVRKRSHPFARRGTSLIPAIAMAVPLLACGCSCEASGASIDAGPLFGGIDAPGYEPLDAGPRPPEPCAVPVRRVRFSLGDESLTHANDLWVSGSRAWVYLGGFGGAIPPSPPPSLHLFDLEAERELETDVILAEEDELLGVFDTPGGFDVVVRSPSDLPRIVGVDHDGRRTGSAEERLELASRPLVRLDDGRYLGMAVLESVTTPVPATLEIATPSGPVQRIELGFETMAGHLTALRRNGDAVVGLGYEDATQSVVRFEVDLDTSAVRLGTLAEGVRLFGSAVGAPLALWASASTASAALTYEHADAPHGSPQIVEVFWWPIGGGPVTRQVVHPASDLRVDILALGGAMPLQTLVLAQSGSSRTWVTAARIRAPGEVIGGAEPLGVFTGISDAAAWDPSEGTVAIALLGQHELEVVYVCEGAP